MKKVALITGGSRGIGAATARYLANHGYAVAVNYKQNQIAAEQLVKELQDSGFEAIALQGDMSNEQQVINLFKTLDKALGRITALVNNAGILKPQMKVVEMTAERINQVLSTNVTSYFLCCREAVKRMSLTAGGFGGAIVNVSSVASRIGAAGEYVDYAASKGAVDTLTTGLSIEVANESIRVNCVRPGFIKTSMHADGGEPDRVERLAPMIPMGRGGEPEEVAAAIAWLLSDEASYVTGSFIDLAGGK
ncbi:SDR family oxidoreductase [Shewanella eurypsychrophilus]|uniref:SDR family oxidoreductase n=1 Tax=Shewanella eurypsychrophilus TaxID=2593656 RepID=A0ABX6V9R1_9GAMM|nr:MULTISPECIES: SDR family oxidoreductase [Shewanella]QFU23885.1 SDR family oxidoreductase [Shewanella sp. YLB-09]QPG59107.1 SDR family oxidoreductase [Shewanella eurypsychrophilus]